MIDRLEARLVGGASRQRDRISVPGYSVFFRGGGRSINSHRPCSQGKKLAASCTATLFDEGTKGEGRENR